MRKILIASALTLALIAGALYVLGRNGAERAAIADLREEAAVSIVLTDEGFKPRYVRVRAGTELIFSTDRENQFWPASNEHPNHSIYPEFDSRHPLGPEESWSFVVTRPGDWSYHDHVRSYYTGRVYVE